MKKLSSTKKVVLFVVLALVFTLLVACNDGEEDNINSVDQVEEEVIAEVNGNPIFRAEFENHLEQSKLHYQAQGIDFSETEGQELLPQIKEQVLEQLIQQEILVQQAEVEGIEITDEELDSYFEMIKSQYNSVEELEEELATVGLSLNDFRENIRGRLLIEELSTKLTADIEVSESQLEEYYTENKEKFVQPEQVEASHILVESLAEAEELKSDLDDGADFAELAKEHSIGPSSQEGGSLGLFAKGQMVPAFEEAAFSLEKEEISDPVETEYGYHLIKVSDKVASRELDLEEVRDDLENYLIEGEKNQLLNDYFEDVYQETEIERMVDFS